MKALFELARNMLFKYKQVTKIKTIRVKNTIQEETVMLILINLLQFKKKEEENIRKFNNINDECV